MRKLGIEEMGRDSIEEFKSKEKTPLVVILENIRSLSNVGSIFRTSDAFNVETIYLVGITPTPPHREIQKTALGATESVNWVYSETIEPVISQLKQNGYTLLTVEQAEGSTDLRNLNSLTFDKAAIILGNEVNGVEQSTIDASDHCIEIPQFGTKHSLNVAVCGGILIWETAKKLIE